MDIKELNKPQIILLAVLLSFVISIATGITTVTLMQQAPASITTPINRIVQQTVEKIQQVEGKTTVQTVVIKEEDLVVDAIAKNQSAIFSIIKEGQTADFKTIENSLGRGFAVSNDGIVVMDASDVSSDGVYFVKNSSGKFKASFISTNEKSGFSFLKIGAPVNSTDKAVFTVPVFGDLNKMKIGQKVLVLGNNVSSFIFEGLDVNKNLDLNTSKSSTGGLVLNLDGEVLGIALSPENTVSSFASIKVISDALAALSSKTSTSVTQ
jgi:S1-C subfamily serine protease